MRLGDLVSGRAGDVPVEDGDVVGVDSSATPERCRRHRRCPPRSLPGVGHRGWPRPCTARPRRPRHACSEDRSCRISSAYPKADTCRQHRAALNGGMNLHRPAPTHPRRISLLAGLLVVLAAIAALGYQSLAASSARVASPSSRGGHRYMPHGVRLSSAWPEYGQAAVILTGQQRIHAGPNQHPAPIASVAKVMTAYLVLRDHPLRPRRRRPDDHTHRRRCRRHRPPGRAARVGRAGRRRRAVDRTAGAAGAAAAVGEQHRRGARAIGTPARPTCSSPG